MDFRYCPLCGRQLGSRQMGDEGEVPFCEACNRPFFGFSYPCVIVTVLNDQDEIALIRQNRVTTVNWVLVAGYIKPGETAEDCVAREVFEEIGLSVLDCDYLSSFYHQKGYRDAISRLGEAYVRNLESYLSRAWPIESDGMRRVATEINGYLDQADLIGRWESLVGIEFRSDLYEIVLCSAIKNGPNANSLGYERNVFYSGGDLDYMRKFISHEVGTHILFPALKDLPARCDPSLAYKASESLARFYNSLVLRTTDLYSMSSSYDADALFGIFESIHRSRSRISPVEFALEGMAKFISSRESMP